MRIHREGVRILVIAIIILAAFCAFFWLFFVTLGLILSLVVVIPFYFFILRFFRVPRRIGREYSEGIVSPCDGTVVAIEEVEENEFLKEKCIQISVFMSVWNVHINWYPMAGHVIYQKYHPGKFLLAWEPKSSTLNERTTVVVQRPDGARVLFRQIAGFLARRIVCYATTGDLAKQGQEMGFIKFGSRVDLFVPLNSEILVELNQKVVGTQTMLAKIP
jgi:phosphatidylserine decarboxylase